MRCDAIKIDEDLATAENGMSDVDNKPKGE